MFKKMFILSMFIFVCLYSSAYAQNVQRLVHDVDLVQVKKILEKAQDKTLTVQETKVLLQELFVHEQPESLMALLVVSEALVCFVVGIGLGIGLGIMIDRIISGGCEGLGTGERSGHRLQSTVSDAFSEALDEVLPV